MRRGRGGPSQLPDLIARWAYELGIPRPTANGRKLFTVLQRLNMPVTRPMMKKFFRALYGDGKGWVCIFCGKRHGDKIEYPQQSFFQYPDDLNGIIRHVR